MKNILLILLTLALAGGPTFDKYVHDFGKISLSDGPQTCTFTLTNDTEEDLTIFAVVTSCGCTDVKWTRETIAPGKKGTVTATYSNDEGAVPFDKKLSVYTSAQNKPVILHLKGVTVSKK